MGVGHKTVFEIDPRSSGSVLKCLRGVLEVGELKGHLMFFRYLKNQQIGVKILTVSVVELSLNVKLKVSIGYKNSVFLHCIDHQWQRAGFVNFSQFQVGVIQRRVNPGSFGLVGSAASPSVKK